MKHVLVALILFREWRKEKKKDVGYLPGPENTAYNVVLTENTSHLV